MTREVALLPSCYSLDLMRCIEGKASALPNCAAIRGAFDGPARGAMEDEMEQMALCPQDQAFVYEAAVRLPDCYSDVLDECLNADDPATHPYPNCQLFSTLWDLDQRAIEALPWCDEQGEPYMAPPKTNWAVLGAAAGLSLVLGFFIGRLA